MLLTTIFPLVLCLFHLLLLSSIYGNFIIISCMSCGVLHSLVFIKILVENNCRLSVANDQLSIVCFARIFTDHTCCMCISSL